MKNYTVIKVVEYFYNIEAETAEDAELFATVRSENEAYQASLINVSAESDIEYTASIKEQTP